MLSLELFGGGIAHAAVIGASAKRTAMWKPRRSGHRQLRARVLLLPHKPRKRS